MESTHQCAITNNFWNRYTVFSQHQRASYYPRGPAEGGCLPICHALQSLSPWPHPVWKELFIVAANSWADHGFLLGKTGPLGSHRGLNLRVGRERSGESVRSDPGAPGGPEWVGWRRKGLLGQVGREANRTVGVQGELWQDCRFIHLHKRLETSL